VSRIDLPPSILWHNWQTEAHLILRLKPKNHHGDFDVKITKQELPVLRPKPGNPPPPWFWGSTKKPTADFEAKPGETVTTNFKVKLEKTIAAGFEAKSLETVRVVLRSNHSQTVDLGFEA
jgi:alkanesulfonate monooxygenase SsuD/methylene tetrahydromethanopterin reductase-like flavin-dependent oxidoreductase (luciferase family)